jgi:hypothetical protein
MWWPHALEDPFRATENAPYSPNRVARGGSSGARPFRTGPGEGSVIWTGSIVALFTRGAMGRCSYSKCDL